jgi:hypothetical protein
MTDKEMFEYLVEKATRLDEERFKLANKLHPLPENFVAWSACIDKQETGTRVGFRTNGLIFDENGSLIASWSEYD